MSFFGDYRTLRFNRQRRVGPETPQTSRAPDEQNLPNLKLNIKATTFKYYKDLWKADLKLLPDTRLLSNICCRRNVPCTSHGWKYQSSKSGHERANFNDTSTIVTRN